MGCPACALGPAQVTSLQHQVTSLQQSRDAQVRLRRPVLRSARVQQREVESRPSPLRARVHLDFPSLVCRAQDREMEALRNEALALAAQVRVRQRNGTGTARVMRQGSAARKIRHQPTPEHAVAFTLGACAPARLRRGMA